MSTQQPESLRLADAIHHLDDEAEISRLHALNAELLEALKEALSVVRSVHTGRDRRVVRDGCVLFMQTDEWCQWLEVELAPKFSGIVAKAEGREA